jgi:MFS family permease
VNATVSRDAGEATEVSGYPPMWRSFAMLLLLMVANVLSFVDRQILGLLVDPVRSTMHISDLQIGLLIGPAFAIFYSLVALPIGVLVDRRSRIFIVALGVALWSLMTIWSGCVSSFLYLLIARMGVAIGEAVLFPAANSLIADAFPPAKRSRALGLYTGSVFLGSGLAFLFGGATVALVERNVIAGVVPAILADRASWQIVFIVVGLPGLLVAAMIARIHEPKRQGVDTNDRRSSLTLRASFERLGQVRLPLAAVCFGNAFLVLAIYSLLAWVPTQLTRGMGVSRPQAGMWLGSIVIGAGFVGVTVLPWLADRARKRSLPGATFAICAAAMALGTALLLSSAAASDQRSYLAITSIIFVVASGTLALAPVALQEIVPSDARGQALALVQFFATIIGAGLGPPLVAWLAGAGSKPHDLRFAIAAVGATGMLLSAICYWAGWRGSVAADRLSA